MTLITQLGYHFAEDTKHYTRAKLEGWYASVGKKTQWICLPSSCHTAIPEVVFQFCNENRIKPIVQFLFNEWNQVSTQDVIPLLQYYKKQGVEFIQLGGYLNQQSTWRSAEFGSDFLSHLSNIVIEFHRMAVEYGFFHILPKFIPGGDYWDLVVLKFLLQQMHDAKIDPNQIILSFTAWINGHPYLWGRGGKKKWSQSQPYQTTAAGEDHRGFSGFEWYQEIAESEFGKKLPIILLEAGKDVLADETGDHDRMLKTLVDFLGNEKNANFFSEVLGICMAYDEHIFTDEIAEYLDSYLILDQKTEKVLLMKREEDDQNIGPIHLLEKRIPQKNISHYLLLPEYDWGISPWHLEVALPFVRKYRPTIGYSLEEAKNATFVTVVMDEDVFSADSMDILKKAGCKVVVIHGDGTEIAAKLASE
jgi:hypothetical protein